MVRLHSSTARRCVVWIGVVWGGGVVWGEGVVWRDVERCGVVIRGGVLRCAVMRDAVMWCDVAWCGFPLERRNGDAKGGKSGGELTIFPLEKVDGGIVGGKSRDMQEYVEERWLIFPPGERNESVVGGK